MLLDHRDAQLFLNLYHSLLGFVAEKLGGVGKVFDERTFRAADLRGKIAVRDRMVKNLSVLDRFVNENPEKLADQDLAIVASWKGLVRGSFIAERELKYGTVFLDQKDTTKAYGVLGITTPITEMVPVPLPAMLDTVLLPWKGRILCDGMIRSDGILLGSNIRRELKGFYEKAKAKGIITSLDPGWRPAPPKPRRAKSPAIARFLKDCPRTVAQFKRRYGEPLIDLPAETARDFGPWRLDGAPAQEADGLMMYDNLIKRQWVYLYALKGKIAHVHVVDPADWKRARRDPIAGR